MTCKDSNNETASCCVDACGNVYYSRDDTLTSVTVNVRPCEKAAPGELDRKSQSASSPWSPRATVRVEPNLAHACRKPSPRSPCQTEGERPRPRRGRETKLRPRNGNQADRDRSRLEPSLAHAKSSHARASRGHDIETPRCRKFFLSK